MYFDGVRSELLDAVRCRRLRGGIKVRVVRSSMEVFEEQKRLIRESVMPSALRRRIAVEAATPLSWHRYTTDESEYRRFRRLGSRRRAL